MSVLTFADLKVPQKTTLAHFIPPPRFGTTRFEDYRPQHATQTAARDRVAQLARATAEPVTVRGGGLFGRRTSTPGRGLYLDGGFGVGKTHLLAACYHASQTPDKAYLSFQELVYIIGVQGMEGAKAGLGGYRLLCIDEFELDDPGNTLMVANFLRHAFAQGALVLTTSNTPAEAQGQGRFNAEQFEREIQAIASSFVAVPMAGPDYRQRDHLAKLYTPDELTTLMTLDARTPKLTLDWQELFTLLAAHHPIRYGDILKQLGSLYLTGASPIRDQNNALRFVHFIDKLYDLRVGLRVAGQGALEALFDPSYRHSAYAKKHYRCLSRLSELLEEDIPKASAAVGSG